jgi:hypothetical protein
LIQSMCSILYIPGPRPDIVNSVSGGRVHGDDQNACSITT